MRRILLATALLFAACSSESPSVPKPPPTPTPTGPVVARVVVAADSAFVAAGARAQLRATAYTAQNAVVEGQAFTWSTKSPAVATVDAGGLLSALSPGTVEVSASVGGVSGVLTLTVRPAPVASVEIVPALDSLVAGTQRPLAAQARAADGTVLTGRPVAWTTSDARVLSIDGAGVATAVSAGTVQVTATVEGHAAAATRKVLPRPASAISLEHGIALMVAGRQLSIGARTTDAAGQTVATTGFQWTSSNVGVATADATGRVTAVAPGEARITVASGALTTYMDVSVYPALPAGSGILQVTGYVPVHPGQQAVTARMLFQVEGGGLRFPIGRLAGREAGGSRFSSAVAQIAVPAGTGYRLRVLTQDARWTERVVGGSGQVDGVAVTAGQVTEAAPALVVPQLQLTAPATVSGGASATFSWAVTAPGLTGDASTAAGLILEAQSSSSSAYPFGGQQTTTTATQSNGVFQSSVTQAVTQTPGVFKVRAFVTGTQFYSRIDGSGVGLEWSAFGPLDVERLLTVQ